MKRICLAFVLSALGSAALAAGTQPVTISSTTPTDLGAAPVFVQTLNQPVNICVADNSPTVGTQCNILQPGPPVTFYPADAGSHVWASILGSSSLIAYTPVYSSGSSIGSVTQGTVPWVDDVQQWADTVLGAPSNFGTSPGAVKVPGVNAYVTDFPSTYAVTGTFWQATQPVSIASGQVASGAFASGAFASGAGADGWDAGAQATTTAAGCASGKGLNPCLKQLDADINTLNTTAGNPIVMPKYVYNSVAALATNYVLSATQGGATGAAGDYLSFCMVQPGTTSPGSITILDNATTVFSFPGGASSVSNLVPFAIPIGAVSSSGGWKITTTANITAECFGKFS